MLTLYAIPTFLSFCLTLLPSLQYFKTTGDIVWRGRQQPVPHDPHGHLHDGGNTMYVKSVWYMLVVLVM
jgi:hypothetical protein